MSRRLKVKRWLWIPILVILVFLLCCRNQDNAEQTQVSEETMGGGIAAVAQAIENNLDLAVGNLENGRVGEGAGLLLDSILLVKPRDQWPAGFRDHIAQAKEHFAAGSFSDGVGEVTSALDLIKQPVDAVQSGEEGEIAPIAAILKGKIAEAKEEFKKGNADQGVIALLEALQLFAPQTN
jgi:hypothetical protein